MTTVSADCDDDFVLQKIIQKVEEWLKEKCNLPTCDVNLYVRKIQTELRLEKWQSQSNYAGIDYNDLKICCGYLHRFAACHSALARHVTHSILIKDPEGELMKLLTDKTCLKVVSVGGGPGNDLLGFCCAIVDHISKVEELHLTVVDLKAGWKHSFLQMMSEVGNGAHYGKLGDFFVKLPETKRFFNFVEQNLCLEVPLIVEEADLILMVKVLSNMSSSQRPKILENIFKSMRKGAIFFCIDINSSIVEDQMLDDMKLVFSDYTRKMFSPICISDGLNRSAYEICILKKD